MVPSNLSTLPTTERDVVSAVNFEDGSDAFPRPFSGGSYTIDTNVLPDQKSFMEMIDELTASSDFPRPRDKPIRLVAVVGEGDTGAQRDLAVRRLDAVRRYLARKGFTSVETRCQSDPPVPEWGQADMVSRSVFVDFGVAPARDGALLALQIAAGDRAVQRPCEAAATDVRSRRRMISAP